MKMVSRWISSVPFFLCLLFLFLPLCEGIGAALGYRFTLYHYPAAIVFTAALSLCFSIALFLPRIQLHGANAVFSAFVLPLAVLNGFFYVGRWDAAILFILVCCGCSAAILIKFARPFALKIITGILSILLFILLLFITLLILAFGNFGSNSVVASAESPHGTYLAEVINSDQGALGGDTLVNVTNQAKAIPLQIGEFSKAPVRVYTGEWGEFESMKIYWQDDRTLIIDGRSYRID